jgi:hypothetical protein
LHDCGTWPLALKEEHKLRALENRIFGCKQYKLAGGFRKLNNVRSLICIQNHIWLIKFMHRRNNRYVQRAGK